jgi:hypothetical protein
MDLNTKKRLDDTFFQIIRLPMDAEKIRDLKKIWKNCSEAWADMSREEVNCRRLGKKTPHYSELETQVFEGLDLLEQYLTFATLLS